MDRLGTESAFDVLAKVNRLKAEGRPIISFGIGEPDFETPDHIKVRAKQALDENETHYGPSAGKLELREEIAGVMSRTRGIEVTPDMVVVSPGAKPVIFGAMMALIDPGDQVIYPSPGYPIYESLADWLGAETVPARLREETGWRYDIDELASLVTPRTKLIVLNSPQNPTGGMLTEADMEAIAEIAIRNDLWVLTDEIYSQITFNDPFASILSVPGMMERTVAVDGFSKTYAMTGWRMGYGVCRPDLALKLAKIETNIHSCTASFTQIAGLQAMAGPQDEPLAMVEAFKRRAARVVELLNGIEGFKCQEAKGAFYAFPNVTKACQRLGLPTANALCDYLLEEANVAVLPRTCFGRRLEEDEYIRLSFATSDENIEEGLRRMKAAVEK
jgi:aspartate/methionine/tyrosine aminotransferase